jgi:hypothetical protein
MSLYINYDELKRVTDVEFVTIPFLMSQIGGFKSALFGIITIFSPYLY